MDLPIYYSASPTIPRSPHFLFSILLALVVLGLHATHLPLIVAMHDGSTGEAMAAMGEVGGEHRLGPNWVGATELGGGIDRLPAVAAAIDVAMNEAGCLAETVATLPRILPLLLLAVGGVAVTTPTCRSTPTSFGSAAAWG